MKKPFDFLITDKEPILYVEKSFLLVKDDCLVRVGADGSIETIPVAATFLLFLGPGTSISHEAAKKCAEHDCYVGFVNGGINVHSLWHAGRWPTPENFLKQAKIFSNPELKLKAAKIILDQKLKKEGVKNLPNLSSISTVESLMGIEAKYAKETYKRLAETYGFDFKRDQNSIVGVNGKISLLNNVLYTYFSAVITAYGLNPSMGFMHGTTRRGGLTFDIADVFKYPLSLVPAFSSPDSKNQEMMHALASEVKAQRSRVTKEAISIIDEILSLSS